MADTQEFYTLLSKTGAVAIANAQLANTTVNITELAVGDGGGAAYSPTDDMTALKNERWRGKIIEKTIDPKNPHIIQLNAIIPATVGGFFVRELASYTDDGKFIHVGNFPEAYKVAMESGASSEFPITLRCLFTSTNNIKLEVDPHTAVASQEWVGRQLEKYVPRDTETQKIIDSMLPDHLRKPEEGVATLSNTKPYPFSTASYTVALQTVRDSTSYNVTTEVVSSSGGYVEEVNVCDKQTNGFKIQFNGSARSAQIKYVITGGLTNGNHQ